MPTMKSTVRSRIIKQVFRELRKEGYICRANYLCCMSCACYSLGQMCDKRAAEGKTVKGAVYWHRQDDDRTDDGGDVTLRYFSADEEKLPMVLVGIRVCKALSDAGIKWDWCGSTHRVITALGESNDE